MPLLSVETPENGAHFWKQFWFNYKLNRGNMQIFMNGRGEKDFAPDQIRASVNFNFHAMTYDEALKGGVEKVKNYIEVISEATDFQARGF